MLTISEELFVLALDEEKGNTLPFAKQTLPHALAGSILADLTLLGKLEVSEKHRLDLKDASLTSDEIIDEAIAEIQASEKQRKLAYWVSHFVERPKKLRERIGEQLVAKNLLTQDGKRFYWRTASPERNEPLVPSKFDLKNPLRASILKNCETDPHDLALLNLASVTGLLGLIFTQDELPMAQHRIYEKTVRAALQNSAMQTIEEIRQAVVTSLEDDMD